jgi:hypothetical protein
MGLEMVGSGMQTCFLREMGSDSLRFRTLTGCQFHPGGRRNGVDDALMGTGKNGLAGRVLASFPLSDCYDWWAVIDCLCGWRDRWGQDLAVQRDQNHQRASHALSFCSLDVNYRPTGSTLARSHYSAVGVLVFENALEGNEMLLTTF